MHSNSVGRILLWCKVYGEVLVVVSSPLFGLQTNHLCCEVRYLWCVLEGVLHSVHFVTIECWFFVCFFFALVCAKLRNVWMSKPGNKIMVGNYPHIECNFAMNWELSNAAFLVFVVMFWVRTLTCNIDWFLQIDISHKKMELLIFWQWVTDKAFEMCLAVWQWITDKVSIIIHLCTQWKKKRKFWQNKFCAV